jgi:hypothetical protein
MTKRQHFKEICRVIDFWLCKFIKDNYDQKFNGLQGQQHPAPIHQTVLRRIKALCRLTKGEIPVEALLDHAAKQYRELH